MSFPANSWFTELILFWIVYSIAFLLLSLTPLVRLSWKFWFYVFALTRLGDVASTFYAIYIRHIPWSQEQNQLVQLFGPRIGFPQTLILCQLLVLGVLYGIGPWFDNEKPKIWKCILIVPSVAGIYLIIGNVLYSHR